MLFIGQNFYEWCNEHNRQDLIDEWDYKMNIDFTPKDMSYGSHKKVWWKCKNCGHEWKALKTLNLIYKIYIPTDFSGEMEVLR